MAEKATPVLSDGEVEFGFANADLADLMDQLQQEGTDVPALLEQMARLDPDTLMLRHRATAYKIALKEASVRRQKAALDLWLEGETKTLRKSHDQLTQTLVMAANDLAIRTKGKVKKLGTPYGFVQLRKAAATIEVDDVDAALEWLQQHGLEQYIRVKREINMQLLKAAALGSEERDPVASQCVAIGTDQGVQVLGAMHWDIPAEENTATITHTYAPRAGGDDASA